MNHGFLADEPSPPTTGALFAPMPDGMRVTDGWRKEPNNGAVPIGATGGETSRGRGGCAAPAPRYGSRRRTSGGQP